MIPHMYGKIMGAKQVKLCACMAKRAQKVTTVYNFMQRLMKIMCVSMKRCSISNAFISSHLGVLWCPSQSSYRFGCCCFFSVVALQWISVVFIIIFILYDSICHYQLILFSFNVYWRRHCFSFIIHPSIWIAYHIGAFSFECKKLLI